MGDKSPRKPSPKKAGKSIKEKRAEKKEKSQQSLGTTQMEGLRPKK
ncbi:MAG: hypothetical protein ACRD0Z_04065 [Acidimicrobiales bacterium]